MVDPGAGVTAEAGELDAVAVERLRRSDPDALAAVVDLYAPRIYNFASRMCRSREDARDILQDTFLAAVRSAGQFRGEGRLSAWLFRIAANACRRMHRRGKFEPAQHLSLDEFMPSPEDALDQKPVFETPDAALLRGDLRSALDEAIAALPPLYRSVLILRDLEGLSTDETAAALGVTPITVKVRLHRARLFLRRRLAAHAGRETA